MTASRYRIPDVSVFTLHEPEMLVPDYPPTVAIEIVSPEDRHDDLMEKLEEYRAFGVPNVWLADPQRRSLQVFDSSGLREVPSLTLPEYNFEVTPADVF